MKTAELLLTSILVALSSVALVIILRNAPVIRGWVQEMKKPWACNVCLPLYLCAGVVGAFFWRTRDLDVLFSYLPGYALSFVVLEQLARPPQVLPSFELEDEDEDEDTPVTRRGFHD